MVHLLNLVLIFLMVRPAQAVYLSQIDLLVNGAIPSITNPLNTLPTDSNGVTATARPDGFFGIAGDPTTLLFDTFETAAVNTTDVWTTGGTAPTVQSNGAVVFAAGTAASATSYFRSKPTFIPTSNAFLQFSALIQLEAGTITGNKRLWGIGVPAASPTAALPLSDGVVFEIDNSTGGLVGAAYAGSVRTQTLALVRPTDALPHRYTIYFKNSVAYFELDGNQVGSISMPLPRIGALAAVAGSFNGTTALSTAASLSLWVIGVADTGKNTTQISDGTFPWRKAKVSSAGTLQVESTGAAATYNASITSLVVAATPTDVFLLSGSTPKTIKVRAATFSCTQTTGTYADITLVKRSTSDTGGTGTNPVGVPVDSANPAATAIVRAYTANPTLGTSVGTLRAERVAFTANGNANYGSNTSSFVWTPSPGSQPVTLRSATEWLAFNLNGVSASGSKCSGWFEWTEE